MMGSVSIKQDVSYRVIQQQLSSGLDEGQVKSLTKRQMYLLRSIHSGQTLEEINRQFSQKEITCVSRFLVGKASFLERIQNVVANCFASGRQTPRAFLTSLAKIRNILQNYHTPDHRVPGIDQTFRQMWQVIGQSSFRTPNTGLPKNAWQKNWEQSIFPQLSLEQVQAIQDQPLIREHVREALTTVLPYFGFTRGMDDEIYLDPQHQGIGELLLNDSREIQRLQWMVESLHSLYPQEATRLSRCIWTLLQNHLVNNPMNDEHRALMSTMHQYGYPPLEEVCANPGWYLLDNQGQVFCFEDLLTRNNPWPLGWEEWVFPSSEARAQITLTQQQKESLRYYAERVCHHLGKPLPSLRAKQKERVVQTGALQQTQIELVVRIIDVLNRCGCGEKASEIEGWLTSAVASTRRRPPSK